MDKPKRVQLVLWATRLAIVASGVGALWLVSERHLEGAIAALGVCVFLAAEFGVRSARRAGEGRRRR